MQTPIEPVKRQSSEPASRAEVASWMFFDFANSSYTTLIISVAYAPYFVRTVVVGDGGSEEDGTFLWGLSYGVSQAIVLGSAPVMGALADAFGAKKKLLFGSFVGCVGATAALGWVGAGDVVLAMVLLVFSNVCFSAGENLIGSFLPEISTPEKMGFISGLGWALGYVGGLGCLLACRPLLVDGFGPSNAEAIQSSFVIVALFFLVGGMPTFIFLKERLTARSTPRFGRVVTLGFSRVVRTMGRWRDHRQLFRFYAVFLCYNSGISIVITFTSIFANGELAMTGGEIVAFFMVVQVSAALGALAFGVLQDRTGTRLALTLSLAIWLAACLGAATTRTVGQFYLVGNFAGLAMGSAQSCARALIGMFSPPSRSGEFFGFWGLVWKLSAAIGPLSFGWTSRELGMRGAIALTGLFFLVGILGVACIDVEAGRREGEVAEALANDDSEEWG